MFGFTDEELIQIREIFSCYEGIEKALIFGSRAKGNYKNGSDVDIALTGAGINADIILEISSFLNEETYLPYRFDLIDYNSVNRVELKEHIDRAGKLIYQKKS